MFNPKQLAFFSLIILCCSCKTESKYNYAIKDFRKALQPYLTRIVSEGLVHRPDSALAIMATDKEIVRISQSEHPVLRASAFREMLRRETFNRFDLIMNHLDDTAVVPTDAGEFGIWYRAVSDDILQQADWEDLEGEKRVIDELITKHNYLSSAYQILDRIEPEEKYYPYIKDMATRRRNYNEFEGESGYDDIEHALYGLAKFKKKEDIQ
jgi:hypothetical protein